MSAFVGILRLDNREVNTAEIEMMLDSMPHRGTDGRGTWTDGPVGLGHRMMHTTKESLQEVLPRSVPGDSVVISSNARIDNRLELIVNLGLGSEDIVTISDSELILQSYLRWGEKAPAKLIGAFSFAIWDADKQHLFCARDLLGMKPFYYSYLAGGFFAVATEAKALLTLPGISTTINENRIADLLTLSRHDVENTIFEDVLKLRSGHALTISTNSIRVERYMNLEADPDLPQDLSMEEYADKLHALMTEAVRCRMRSAFPVSSQLSGGLDSSYVTAIAADLMQEDHAGPLHTLSVVFDEEDGCDEREFIQPVIDEKNVNAQYIYANDFGALTDIEDIYSVVDDAVLAGNHDTIWRMLMEARKNGSRVVLDGIDGDSTIGHGTGRFHELVRASRWDEFSELARACARRYQQATYPDQIQTRLSSISNIVRFYAIPGIRTMAVRREYRNFIRGVLHMKSEYGLPIIRTFKKGIIRLIAPDYYWRWRELSSSEPYQPPGILSASFVDRMKLAERYRSVELAPPEFETETQQQQWIFTESAFEDACATADICSSAHGIELRHPFCDLRLIRFCLALPVQFKFSDGWTRLILRRAMENCVPRDICWRDGKADLTGHFIKGLTSI